MLRSLMRILCKSSNPPGLLGTFPRNFSRSTMKAPLMNPLKVATHLVKENNALQQRRIHSSIVAKAGLELDYEDASSSYRLPPKDIMDIIEGEDMPSLSISPDRKRVLQLHNPPPHPPITELARPELKLAGLRIDAEQWSRSRMSYQTSISVVDLTPDLVLPAPPGKERRIEGIPEGMWINYVSWSPCGSHVAFTLRSAGGAGDPPRRPMRVWVADINTCQAREIMPEGMFVNAIFDDYLWLDDDHIVVTAIPRGVGAAPARPPAPIGPKVQTNESGRTSQARTYPDLLQGPYDASLFEYYSTSELVRINVKTGEHKVLAPPRMYTDVDPSPDGRFLVVDYMTRPFSFELPCGRFPRVTELWDREGNLVRVLRNLPLAEDIPIAFNSCRKGPRGIEWREDKGCTLVWAETQDGGDPAVEVSPRDIVYTLEASSPPPTPPSILATTDLRYGGISWGDGQLALLYESWYKTRRSVTYLFRPDEPEGGKEVLFDRNYEDVYSDPGSPLLRRHPLGTSVLFSLDPPSPPAPSASPPSPYAGRRLLMTGVGATPEGYRPFLDTLDLGTRETTRLWRSRDGKYERMGSLTNDIAGQSYTSVEGLRLLLTSESQLDPPQYYFYTLAEPAKAAGTDKATDNTPAAAAVSNGHPGGNATTDTDKAVSDRGASVDASGSGRMQQITWFPHPYPQLRDLQKQILQYPRADGTPLQATLYLPPGYDPKQHGPLPCLLWAYPREFKTKDAAGQMRRSPWAFAGIGSLDAKLWLSRGYAILDGPTFPIIGEGEAEANDTFIEQLTSSAKAAIDHVAGMGVVDPKRVAVGGHSYGAFMAANLLAHSGELFACGIGRSGAYNRTLTPFGFQNEERTIWQARDVYMQMSPFLYADKIKKPLLLIHGEDDNNTGTFPMQSERFYAALKGHGGQAKLVILPHESHGYRARESILHTLYEMDTWLETYCPVGEGGFRPPAPGKAEGKGEGEVAAAAPPVAVSKL